MQASHTAHTFRRDDDRLANYKPVKYSQSDQSNDQRQYLVKQHSPRSMSSSFRQSIRRLTSCASARRKPVRNAKQGPPILESASIDQTEQRYSSKPSLLPKKSSLPLRKQSHHSVESTADDTPPAVPPRQPLDKKNSAQMQSAILNPAVLSQSPAQISSNATDDTLSQSSLAPARILPSKEISTSLVNLMGDASRSVNGNNNTQSTTTTTTTQEARRISTGHSNTIERLGLLDTLSNASTAGMVESPSAERTVFNGNQATNSYQKSTNEYSWCYESSIPSQTSNGTSFDESLPQLEMDDKPLIYRQQFDKTEHFNWYGTSESNGPVIISYKHVIDQTKQRSVLAIVRIRRGTSIETIFDVHSSAMPIEILRRICQQCGIADVDYFDPVFCDGTHELLIKYDESHVSNQHKFGIIYQRENQLTEEDLFSNERHSPAMEKFLDLIGTRVKLKDFRGFRGGLDVKSDQTGSESVYEQFQNHEIMFHVSTLLPHSKSERQQLERKRHIGNDIVAIIFQEKETTFSPECIASQFLHVYLVVTPVNSEGTELRVTTIFRDNVPAFGPNSSPSPLFHSDQICKQWILTKLINAEMAACRAPTIQKFHERTRMSLFENLYRTLHENNRPLMNLILYHSQYKRECEIEQQQQQREEMQKTSERDSSLLGSVRRRFIAPKLRVQNTANENGKASPTTIIITTPPSNESRSKTRSMTMDLRRSVSRESITTNGNHSGKMTSFFSSSKTNTPRMDKSTTSRSLLDQENIDSYSSPRSTNKFLSPATCPSSPWAPAPPNGFPTSSSSNEFNQNGNSSYSHSTSMLNTSFQFNNKSLSDETDMDNQVQLVPDDLQSSTKEDLIKFVLELQQQHHTKLAHIDQIHSNALKRLELQLMQQQGTVDRDSP